jgi:hypothetical protein
VFTSTLRTLRKLASRNGKSACCLLNGLGRKWIKMASKSFDYAIVYPDRSKPHVMELRTPEELEGTETARLTQMKRIQNPPRKFTRFNEYFQRHNEITLPELFVHSNLYGPSGLYIPAVNRKPAIMLLGNRKLDEMHFPVGHEGIHADQAEKGEHQMFTGAEGTIPEKVSYTPEQLWAKELAADDGALETIRSAVGAGIVSKDYFNTRVLADLKKSFNAYNEPLKQEFDRLETVLGTSKDPKEREKAARQLERIRQTTDPLRSTMLKLTDIERLKL